MNSTIAVAVSGGVDSLYALVSLRDKGESVIALHARMLPKELEKPGYEAMLERLQTTCDALGVSLTIADCVAEFADRVIAPFVRAYAAGMTPNPCAHCNARVKFGLLLDTARGLGAERIATGHYAALEQRPEGVALYAGEDKGKDQSYFLSLVPAERLGRAVTPLAAQRKPVIRACLAERGIPVPAPSESQEICFVPHDDYRAFLTARAASMGIALPGGGPVNLEDGTPVGRHAGLWQYTEGQRKGLGIAWKEPLYVSRKDLAANVLVVAGARELTGGEIRVEDFNYLLPFEVWPQTVFIRTRYRQTARPATPERKDGLLVLTEEVPSGPYARGQIASVYALETTDGKERLRVLGGGVIAG
jgi:tRNA-specific 2-thiouridylase